MKSISEIEHNLLPVEWVGDSLARLKEFPDDVQDEMGYALFYAQTGRKFHKAKRMKDLGKHISGVVEIIDDYDGDTYRSVYTVRFKDAVYVLHAFQKKSKSGIKTPKPDLDIIKKRHKLIQEIRK